MVPDSWLSLSSRAPFLCHDHSRNNSATVMTTHVAHHDRYCLVGTNHIRNPPPSQHNIPQTYTNDGRFPMLSGMLPLNWLYDRSKYLFMGRQQHTLDPPHHTIIPLHTALSAQTTFAIHRQQHNITQTYCNDVRFPVLSGMLPLNWLCDRYRYLITGRQQPTLNPHHHTITPLHTAHCLVGTNHNRNPPPSQHNIT